MAEKKSGKRSYRLILGGGRPTDHDVQWHSRGYLPHYEDWSLIQSVTFRLADSMPRHAVEQMQHMEDMGLRDPEYRKQIEAYMDAGHGVCWLRQKEIASRITEILLHAHLQRYILHAWVIMPNHVHILFEPIAPFTLSDIMKEWKSFSAHEINRILGRKGQIWHEEYWDRYIRSQEHYQNCTNYIRENPVKAGLVNHSDDWPWQGFLKAE